MRPELRFERALDIPDGIVDPDHRLAAIALKLLADWNVRGGQPRTVQMVEECLRILRKRYVDGHLDRLILGPDQHREAKLSADVEVEADEALTDKTGGARRAPPRLVKQTVESVLAALRSYVYEHPVDVD